MLKDKVIINANEEKDFFLISLNNEYNHDIEIAKEEYDSYKGFSFCWTCTDKEGVIIVLMDVGKTISTYNELKDCICRDEGEDAFLNHIGALKECCVIMKKFFDEYGFQK